VCIVLNVCGERSKEGKMRKKGGERRERRGGGENASKRYGERDRES
jgi:hypothetical protein